MRRSTRSRSMCRDPHRCPPSSSRRRHAGFRGQQQRHDPRQECRFGLCPQRFGSDSDDRQGRQRHLRAGGLQHRFDPGAVPRQAGQPDTDGSGDAQPEGRQPGDDLAGAERGRLRDRPDRRRQDGRADAQGHHRFGHLGQRTLDQHRHALEPQRHHAVGPDGHLHRAGGEHARALQRRDDRRAGAGRPQ